MKKIKSEGLLFYILLFLSFVINVLLTLPFLSKLIQIRSRYFPVLCALFLGVLGFFFIPHMEGDYTRIISRVNYLDPKIIITQPDLFLPVLIYIISILKLPKQVIGSISVFILYYYTLKSLLIVIKNKNMINKNFLLIVIIYFFSIPILLFTGVRFSTALSLYIYGIVILWFEENKLKSLLFLLFSVCTHFSFYFPAILTIIFLKKYNLKMLKVFLFLNIILGIILSPENILYLSHIINEIFNINLIADLYITGEWGGSFLVNKSILSKFVYYLNRLLQIFILLYYNFCLNFINSKKLKKFICFLTGPMYFFMIHYKSPSFRYFIVILLLIILETVDLKIFIKKVNKLKILYLVICSYSFFNLIIEIYLQYKSFLISYGKIYNLSLFHLFYKL